MSTPPPYPDKTLELFGQQGSAGVSTPFVFCFSHYGPLQHTPTSSMVAKLQEGVERLARAFPWTAGRVVKVESSDETSAGIYKIRHTDEPPRVIFKDSSLRESLNMKEFVEDGCPCTALPEKVFSPYDVLPGKADQVEARSAVMTLQVNEIRGGLLVNLVGHHQVLDGRGQERVAYLLDKACRGEPFTEEEIRIGNMEREDVVVPLPDEWQPRPDSQYLMKYVPVPTLSNVKWETSPSASTDPTEPCWTDFTFSAKALIQLKAQANRQLESGYVSTDDVMTTLIWQALARARSGRYPLETTSTIGRAVDPRRYLGIPTTYPGYISNMAYSTRSLGSLIDSPLGSIAQDLRAAVDPSTSNLGQTTRELATLIHRAQDKDSVSVITGLNPEVDLMLSSWANMRCGQFDFDLGLGPPVGVRRTLIPPVLGLMYFLPKGPAGEIVLHICARKGDLSKMQADPVFAEYVGDGSVVGTRGMTGD
jgi:hypothetical protein